MAANHKVQPGDCLNSIAKENGFFNYLTVYKHGANKKNFPNPNTLEEGKQVEVPDKKTKKAPLKLDKETKFLLDRRKTRLRLVVLDADFKVPKLKSCKVSVGVESTKLPDKKGLVEIPDLEPNFINGTMEVELDVPPPPSPPAPAAANPKAYPLVIVEKDFLDKNPDPAKQTKVEWALHIGFLEPHTTIRGVTHRLRNYGYFTPIVQAEDDKTKAAVNAYQLSLGLKKKGAETGAIADIRDDIRKRHDRL